MGTPQHPGFKKKRTFGAKKKPLREWGHRNTLVLGEKVTFWAKKKPLREWGHRNTLVLGPLYALGPLYWQCPLCPLYALDFNALLFQTGQLDHQGHGRCVC